ncbi:UMP kinase [Candidatus Falkowbacteria bacterium]|nr:UMP kinase [Candidatus Falkowbacteria bacterium]
MSKKTIVISLGGSLVAPREGVIDYQFLKKFKQLITKHLKRGTRFIIVVGGGKTARAYQAAARRVGQLTAEDIDWIGIHSTRLNAHLLRTIFRASAHAKIVTNPNETEKFREPVLIGAGWRPGWSTDYVAARLATGYGAVEVVNLSNIDYVYSRDPRQYRDAKKIIHSDWVQFKKIVGTKWTPGANLPFDPVASRWASQHRLRVLITNGKKLAALDRYLSGGRFSGTVIE